MSRQQPSRAPKGVASSCSLAPATEKDREFPNKLRLIRDQIRKLRKGCPHCGCGCLEALQDQDESVMSYRLAFRRLPKDVQDRYMLWMFGGAIHEPP